MQAGPVCATIRLMKVHAYKRAEVLPPEVDTKVQITAMCGNTTALVSVGGWSFENTSLVQLENYIRSECIRWITMDPDNVTCLGCRRTKALAYQIIANTKL